MNVLKLIVALLGASLVGVCLAWGVWFLWRFFGAVLCVQGAVSEC